MMGHQQISAEDELLNYSEANFSHHRAIQRAILALLVLTVLLMRSTAPAAEEADKSGQSERILQSASELDYPPFAIVRPDGSADGFSVDLLKAVTKVVGLDIHFAVDPWHLIKQQLVEGRLDVLPLVSYSPERDRVFDFSAPYLRMRGGIFVRKGDHRIHDERDLKDKELLVMRGDTAHEYAVKQHLSNKLVLTNNFEEAMKQLSQGKHDAVIIQQLVGFQLIKKLHLTNVVSANALVQASLKPVGKPLGQFEQKFCFAVHEGDKELLSRLNEGLAIVITSGEYDQLYQKWFSPILPPPAVSAATIAKYLLFILVPILLFGAIIGVWYLRRKVREKTAHLEQEIKERIHAEESLVQSVDFTRSILNNLPIGVAVNSVEPTVDFSYMNDNFPRIYRTSREALANQDAFWEEVYHDPVFRAQLKRRVLEDCASNDPERMHWEEIPINRKGEETRYINAKNIPVPGRRLVISTVWDVTETKRAEEQLARLNANLIAKNEELEHLLYVASHDLRSPLVNIDGYSKELASTITAFRKSLLNTGAAEQIPAAMTLVDKEIPDALRFIQASVSKMNMLLAGLLRLSRLGREALKIVSLDMNGLMAEVVAAMEFQIKETDVHLEIADLPPCRGDKMLVNQIFTNLLDNALKYLDKQCSGLIRINGWIGEGKVVYCVEDNGIGIDQAHQEKIFRLFHRLNSEQSEGEGLGLTIVKRILSRLEGDIWLESTYGSGSRFYVSLPRIASYEHDEDEEDEN